MDRAEARGASLATSLGLPGADATLEQLRATPAEAVIRDRSLGAGLRTVLDGRVKTQSILDSFAAGTAIDVPFILGTNSDEGRLSGTQRVATHAMGGAPVWQYFFDYVPDWRRAEQPNGVPHAGEIPYVFDTLAADRAGARMTPRDHAVAARMHSCWVAFAKAAKGVRSLTCADGFDWPARSEANGRAVAIFEERPRLGHAATLRSPPNGAKPGPTSRDEE
jgi:para-nitrobenzyl esterase